MPINYQNGKIYKLSNNVNDLFYIGSTTTSLASRKSKFNCIVKKSTSRLCQEISRIGWKDGDGKQIWVIEEIEKYPCNSVDELHVREGYWQRHFRQECPEKLLNQRLEGNLPGEKQARASKVYKQNHPEKVQAAQKSYIEMNKDTLNAKKRENVICEICNQEVTRNSLREHKMSLQCQLCAVNIGLIKQDDIVILNRQTDTDAKKEYDRKLYLKRKEEGYYEHLDNGGRQYATCEWILQRASKDGKKKGDTCGKSCNPATNGEKSFCGMHLRVRRNNKMNE